MAIEVKLEAFEGPLDLLLHLIEKNKVDIYDIPIAEITEQYLEHMDKMEFVDLDMMSDFIVVASELLKIKSKMLLPIEKDEEDPRSDLATRLIEYKMFKYYAECLKEKTDGTSLIFYKEPSIPNEVEMYEEKPDLTEIIGDLTISELYNTFLSLMRRHNDRIDPVRSKFNKIENETVSLNESIQEIKRYGKKHRCFTFKYFLTGKTSKLQIVISFLAILELMKQGTIRAFQDNGKDIRIETV